jgi:hypothetical protein
MLMAQGLLRSFFDRAIAGFFKINLISQKRRTTANRKTDLVASILLGEIEPVIGR